MATTCRCRIPALVSAQSDLGIASSRLGRARELAQRSLSLGLVAPLGLGALAGLAFGGSDVVRASLANGWVGVSSALAVLGLWQLFGQIVGLALWLNRRVAAAIKPRLPKWLQWHTVLALTAGVFTLLLARKVFAGAGVRRTLLGSWGTWGVPLAVASTAWVALWIAARFAPDDWLRLSRRAVVFVAAPLSLGAAVLDARSPNGYLFLHVLLLTTSLVLATETIELIGLPIRARQAALAASLMTVPALIVFPSSLQARELLAQPTWAGLQLVVYTQLHVDFDGDGHSPLFGGGDCNDRDASVFVGAPEKPGDGRDSDCDGFDEPKVASLAFAQFRVASAGRSREFSERARKFPTVVILIDALRFDRVGNSRFPNLALLSRESIRYTRMYSASSTTLTSVPAMATGSTRPARSRDNIAQSLARAGQVSAFIAPDVMFDHFRAGKSFDPLLGFSIHKAIPTDSRYGWGRGETVTTSEQITAGATELVDSSVPPDLVWLHYLDLHQWDTLEEPGLPTYTDVARYDAVLERMDASLRPLLERRDRINLVLLADHGEGLGARHVTGHTAFVFEELSHVPFLVRIPGTEPATVDVPLGSTGVFNTLRALRGLESDGTVPQDLLELVGATNVGNGPGFASFEREQSGFLFGHYRLLYMPRQQLVELYDVARDARDQKNLVDAEPQLASQMLARLFQLQNEPRQ